MGNPFFGVDNVFSFRQYIGFLLTANEEDTGREAFRAVSGRRSKLDFWAPTTANAAAQIEVDGLVASAISVDYWAFDRGHNLGGEIVDLERSTDGIAWTNVDTVTIPSTAGGQIDDANGCLTDEGAWIRRLAAASTADRHLRINVRAMGVGLTPRVVGLWAGTHYAPGPVYLPLQDEDDILLAERTQSPKGWAGSTIHVRKRIGDLNFKLLSIAAYTTAATHIRDNYGRGRLMWIIHDDANSRRAVLAQRPIGRAGFQFPPDFGFRTAVVPWEEYEPFVDTASP